MKRNIAALLGTLLLVGCDQFIFYKHHPKFVPSNKFILANFGGNAHIPVNEDVGYTFIALMSMGVKCNLIVDVEKIDHNTLLAKPMSVHCKDDRIKVDVPNGAMSDAFINTHFANQYDDFDVRFELYNSEFIKPNR